MTTTCYCCEKEVPEMFTESCLHGRICCKCADKVRKASRGISPHAPHCSQADKKFCGGLNTQHKAFPGLQEWKVSIDYDGWMKRFHYSDKLSPKDEVAV